MVRLLSAKLNKQLNVGLRTRGISLDESESESMQPTTDAMPKNTPKKMYGEYSIVHDYYSI